MQTLPWQDLVLLSAGALLAYILISVLYYGPRISAILSHPGVNRTNKRIKAIARRDRLIYCLLAPLCSVVLGSILANYVYFSTEGTRTLAERQLMLIGAYAISYFIPMVLIKAKQWVYDG